MLAQHSPAEAKVDPSIAVVFITVVFIISFAGIALDLSLLNAIG